MPNFIGASPSRVFEITTAIRHGVKPNRKTSFALGVAEGRSRH
jgi:hypothetical protein